MALANIKLTASWGETCPRCGGSGTDGSKYNEAIGEYEICKTCNGEGMVEVSGEIALSDILSSISSFIDAYKDENDSDETVFSNAAEAVHKGEHS